MGAESRGGGTELESQKATPKCLAQVLCWEKVRRAAAPSRGCVWEQGCLCPCEEYTPICSTYVATNHCISPSSPHSLLTEGRAERGAEKRRRFNRCLRAQCTFSRIHGLPQRRGQCGHFVSRRCALVSEAGGEGGLEIKTSGAPGARALSSLCWRIPWPRASLCALGDGIWRPLTYPRKRTSHPLKSAQGP